jgi:TonB family protein
MAGDWKQWEGQVIADAFPLRQYLGGDGDHAVFLSEYGQPAPQKAAIKIVLGPPESTESQLSRWHLASKLSHPNLLRIFSKGGARLGDTPLIYMVMEYADESLAQVIPVRPLSADEARQMIEPALSVLAYLHGEGFVHGHLKPANILASGECLKISSAALCRVGECPPSIPDAYTPPEEGAASPAGDVWSLGITLVEALTQRLPARSATHSVAQSNDPVVPDTLPQPFLGIARQCLRSDPKARSTVADISARLQPPAKPPTRRPMLKWAYALAVTAGLGVAAFVIAPRLIDRHTPVAPAEPAQIPRSAPIQPTPIQPTPIQPTPIQPAPKVRAAPPQAAVRNEIVQRVLPEVPSQARRTIQGRVKVSVRVRVDPSGNVAEAKLDSAGPSKYFAQLALQAARRWKFAPAPEVDPAQPREWILHFEFERTGTKVASVRRAT